MKVIARTQQFYPPKFRMKTKQESLFSLAFEFKMKTKKSFPFQLNASFADSNLQRFKLLVSDLHYSYTGPKQQSRLSKSQAWLLYTPFPYSQRPNPSFVGYFLAALQQSVHIAPDC